MFHGVLNFWRDFYIWKERWCGRRLDGGGDGVGGGVVVGEGGGGVGVGGVGVGVVGGGVVG